MLCNSPFLNHLVSPLVIPSPSECVSFSEDNCSHHQEERKNIHCVENLGKTSTWKFPNQLKQMLIVIINCKKAVLFTQGSRSSFQSCCVYFISVFRRCHEISYETGERCRNMMMLTEQRRG